MVTAYESLPPGGRWHGVAVTEGACVTLDLDYLIVTRSPSVAYGDSSLPEGALNAPFLCG